MQTQSLKGRKEMRQIFHITKRTNDTQGHPLRQRWTGIKLRFCSNWRSAENSGRNKTVSCVLHTVLRTTCTDVLLPTTTPIVILILSSSSFSYCCSALLHNARRSSWDREKECFTFALLSLNNRPRDPHGSREKYPVKLLSFVFPY